MIREITPPPGQRLPVRSWFLRFAVYALALVTSTTVVGAAFGGLGSLANIAPHPWLWALATAVLACAYSLRELDVLRLPMPQIHWQVPAQWARRGKTMQMLLYGGVLGAEVFTLIPYATFYILVALELAQGPKNGALVGFIYGVARIAPVALSAIRVGETRSSNTVAQQIYGNRHMLHGINGVSLMLVGQVLLTTLLLIR